MLEAFSVEGWETGGVGSFISRASTLLRIPSVGSRQGLELNYLSYCRAEQT